MSEKSSLRRKQSSSGQRKVVCYGLYRHIRIGQGETLEWLHEAMPDLTTTMHTHFFLDNRVWSQAAANFSSYMEEDECYTNEYKLCEALSMGQKFLYIFDFGEERRISCKALRELNESAEKAEVVRVSGEAPEQNGGY